MSGFKDHFSGHAASYREARPTYPPALFAWLAQQAPDAALAWDVGCGNGQAALALVQHFSRVIGTDPSANQIASASTHANIEYRIEPAERSSLDAASVSLVGVAQAVHWFDFDPFYAEVRRVLKPGGIVAVWTYADCQVGDRAIDGLIQRLYVDLTGPYWPPERAYIDAEYRSLPFPFREIAAPHFPMVMHWNVDQLLAYLRSWSATQRYMKAEGHDPVGLVETDLRRAWRAPTARRDVHWAFHLRVGNI